MNPSLSDWETFYVVMGSASGALVGLQFVVVTLMANSGRQPSAETVNAYATPTVGHFAFALLVAAVMSAPWPSITAVSIAVGLTGLGGLIYGALAASRAWRQTDYQPEWDDWLWYSILPLAAHCALALSGLALHSETTTVMFVIAAADVGIIFIGIHNAWDSVIYTAFRSHADAMDASTGPDASPRPPPAPEAGPRPADILNPGKGLEP